MLLASGVTPASGWAYVAESLDQGSNPVLAARVGAIAEAALAGEPVGDAIVGVAASVGAEESAWRGLAAAWQIATVAGAPLARTLSEFAETLRAIDQNQRDLRTALASPTATARMVMVLPVVGVLFGMALGFDTLGTLFGTTPGLVCLALGLVLMLVAHLWSRRMLRRARPRTLTPGLTLDLAAIALSGGSSTARAMGLVAETLERTGLADNGNAETIDDVLALSRRAGVPAAALLRSEAAEARREARSEGERTAAKLAVLLMLPLGLCVLPAFMLLGVAPLLIAIIGSTVTSL